MRGVEVGDACDAVDSDACGGCWGVVDREGGERACGDAGGDGNKRAWRLPEERRCIERGGVLEGGAMMLAHFLPLGKARE